MGTENAEKIMGAAALGRMKDAFAKAKINKSSDAKAQVSQSATQENGNTDGLALRKIAIGDIQTKIQVRKHFENIEELAESIKEEGLKQPIVVGPLSGSNKYIVQQGERRYRACQHLGLPTIECLVTAVPENPADVITGELVENIQREELTPLEIADAMGELLKLGLKQADIARKLGKKPQWVGKYSALYGSPEALKDLFETGVTKDLELPHLMNNLAELNPDRVEQLCAAAANDGITRQKVKEAFDDEKLKKQQIGREALDPKAVTPGRQEPERSEKGGIDEKPKNPPMKDSDTEDQEELELESGKSESMSDLIAENAVNSGPLEPSKSPAEDGRSTSDIPSKSDHDAVAKNGSDLPVIEVSVVLGNSEARGTLDLCQAADSPEKCWVNFSASNGGSVSRRQIALEEVVIRKINHPEPEQQSE